MVCAQHAALRRLAWLVGVFAVLGQRAHPATLAQLWDERFGDDVGWGLFGGVNVPMSSWIYRVLNGLLVDLDCWVLLLS